MSKRNVGLDMVRILASLMVIGIHVAISPYMSESGTYDYSRTLFQCLMGDAVAFFWLITGFNLFSNYSYKKRLKSLAVKQVIPMLAFLVFSFLFSNVIFDSNACFTFEHSSEEYASILDSIKSWNPPPVTGNLPLWYMYVYILLIVFSPTLNAVVKWIDSDKKNEMWFALSSVAVLVLNDLTANALMEFSHHTINALACASIMVIWGHIIGKHKDIYLERNPTRLMIGGFLMYFGVNFIRSKIQFNDYITGTGTHSIFWFTSYGLMCSIGLTISICSLLRKVSKDSVMGKITVFVASLTYPVYLIHHYMIALLNNRFDLNNKIKLIAASCKPDTIVEEIVYYFLELLCVFSVCLIISYLIRLVWRLI